MTLLTLPRRTHHSLRATGWRALATAGGDTERPDITELIDAALEAGALYQAPRRVTRRHRTRRTAGIVVLLGVAAGLVMAYRWWHGRKHTGARLAGEPARPDEAAPHASSRTDQPVEHTRVVPEEGRLDAQEIAVPAHSEACATVERVALTPRWDQRQPEPPRRRDVERPARPSGWGPSPAPPPVPAARPSLPGRPGLRLPR